MTYSNNKKKKLLFFSDCFIYGGCEIVIANLMNSKLIHQNFDVKYSFRDFKAYSSAVKKKIISKWHKLLLPLKLMSNGNIYYFLDLNIEINIIRKLLKFPFFIIQNIGIYSFFNFFKLLSFFKKQNPDILFINNGGYPGSEICRLAVKAAKKANINKILFNVNNIAYPPKSSFEKKENIFIGKNVDYFITASFAARNALIQTVGFNPDKIVSIPNTINEELLKINAGILKKEFNINDNIILLGSVGLLTKRKGFEILIQAISEVIKYENIPEFKVFIFGEGEDRKKLGLLIDELNLKNIFLPGHKEDILSYVNDFDLFILPSISNEDMPYVILEAMMLKKSVIGTNVAGIPEEIKTGKTGFVVAPGDIHELANAIIKLLIDKELRVNLSEQAYIRYNELFSYNIIINKYYELFKNILK